MDSTTQADATKQPASRLRESIPHRLKAAGIHLSLSAIVFVVALYLILVEWFPGFHFFVDGGWQGVRLMAAIDLVLGPMLTLIIFNPFKARKLIVFDLSCIGVAQVAALAWGFYAIHSQHPVAMSHFEGSVYPVIAEPVINEGGSLEQLAGLSDRKPALVYVGPVETEAELERAATMELFGGVAEFEDPTRFRKFAPNWDTIKASAVAAAVREKAHAPFTKGLAGFLAGRGGAAGDYLYFPYLGRHAECTLAFSKQGELLDAIGCAAY